ncbi:MAG: ParA family protein [Phycisphaerales bacterium]|nr:ParA family protein [Phycisphaerales bacterium]
MSQTIAFVNGKGGTGKTTLALLVAWVLNFRGQNVCIDDRDPQGNATAAATAYGIPILTPPPVITVPTLPIPPIPPVITLPIPVQAPPTLS